MDLSLDPCREYAGGVCRPIIRLNWLLTFHSNWERSDKVLHGLKTVDTIGKKIKISISIKTYLVTINGELLDIQHCEQRKKQFLTQNNI